MPREAPVADAVDTASAEGFAVAEEVRDLAARDLGHRPALAGAPEPVYAGCGPHAVRLRLDTANARWSGPLIARGGEGDERGAGPRDELRWIAAVRALGLAAPDVPAPDASVVVFREPAGANLAKRMIDDMAALPRLLAAFGRLHAALHGADRGALDHTDDRSVAGPLPHGGPTGAAGPLLAASLPPDLPAGAPAPPAAGTEPGRGPLPGDGGDDPLVRGIGQQAAWLQAHRPPPGGAVICHGDLTPAHVYVTDDAGGGDDPALVPVNWTGTVLAEPEYDVAATLAGFWTAPLFVPGAVQRRMLKMVRDPLASGYLSAYVEAGASPLDDARLRYWQAFHVHRVAAGIVRCRLHGPADAWDTAAHVAQPRTALGELARRFRALVRDL